MGQPSAIRRAGDRSPAIDLALMAALALLAEDRAPVGVFSAGGLETAGELVAAGDDVLTLRTGIARPPAGLRAPRSRGCLRAALSDPQTCSGAGSVVPAGAHPAC